MFVELDKLKKISGIVLIIGLMLIPSWLWFHFNGISLCPEAMDCAQLGRNIAQGRGFTTGFIRPTSLFFADRLSDHPDLYHPPLYPFLLSLAFRIGGASDKVVFLFSLILFWITGLLIVLLARKIFNPLTALLVAVIYFTNAALLDSVYNGSPVLLESLLLVGLLFLLYYRKGNSLGYFLIGLFFGVTYLSSYLWLWFMAPLIIYLFLASRGMSGRKFDARLLVYLGAGFILMVLAWWLLRPLKNPRKMAG